MISEQQTAPDFSVSDENGTEIRLADFKADKNVVLYFYPKDDTSGCTIEAQQFSRYIDDFTQHDAVVLGVSKDDCASHVDFINKFGLQVSLLADTDGVLCDAYDVWQEKEKNGVKKMGIVRSTFVIDKTGVIRHAEYSVTPDGHAQAILDIVKGL